MAETTPKKSQKLEGVAPVLTRFAPTPSGFLHLGNAYSFIFTYLHALEKSANILLRIDDLDAARKRPEYVEDIFRSLDWLGLTYDLGPLGPDDFEANYSQRHRLSLYQDALTDLSAIDCLFACTCSRSTIRGTPDGQHPTDCRSARLPLDAPNHALRFATPVDQSTESWNDLDGRNRAINLHDVMRDPVLKRRDGLPAYQVASVVDDNHFGVNLVIRGSDLLVSSAVQRRISRCLPNNNFHQAMLLHHPLLQDAQERKLSKSEGAESLQNMRQLSSTPDELYRQVSPLFGLKEPVNSLVELRDAWVERSDGAR